MFGGGDCIAIVSVHNSKFYVFSRETISAISTTFLGCQTGQKQKLDQQLWWLYDSSPTVLTNLLFSELDFIDPV